MALASTSWGDYAGERSAYGSTKFWRGLLGTLVTGAVVMACAAGGMTVLHRIETLRPAAANPFAAEMAAAKQTLAYELSRPLLERNAERFLEDSLLMTQQCWADCTELNGVVAEANRFGQFRASNLAVQSMGQTFTVPAAPSAVALSSTPAPTPTVTATPPAPLPVRIEPSVVVPLLPAIPTGDAPLPAPRLDRSSETMTTFSPLGEAVEQPAPPPVARLTPPVTPAIGRNDGVAIYDISAATVYLPDGERLEAHSGVGYMADNPRYVDRRNIGPTPPTTYNLEMRKGRFHGVEALRLLPADGNNRYGRVGLLAHTYLLRNRPAQSNGCVAFKDYGRFLEAFKRGAVKRLIVVPSLSQSSMRVASAAN